MALRMKEVLEELSGETALKLFFTETRFTYVSMEGRAWLNLAGLQSNKDFYS